MIRLAAESLDPPERQPWPTLGSCQPEHDTAASGGTPAGRLVPTRRTWPFPSRLHATGPLAAPASRPTGRSAGTWRA